MEDDCFDILCQIGYCALPTKENVSSRYAIKAFHFSTTLLHNERGRIFMKSIGFADFFFWLLFCQLIEARLLWLTFEK